MSVKLPAPRPLPKGAKPLGPAPKGKAGQGVPPKAPPGK
jgi:hypothetical protein